MTKTISRRETEECLYYKPELNLDKIKTVDDCKKVLKFIYDNVFQPIPKANVYYGFEEVKEYFDEGSFW